MHDYFLSHHHKKLTIPDQPVIKIKKSKNEAIYLPTELCMMAGMPDSFRNNNQLMRKIKYTDPNEKIAKVEHAHNIIKGSEILE